MFPKFSIFSIGIITEMWGGDVWVFPDSLPPLASTTEDLFSLLRIKGMNMEAVLNPKDSAKFIMENSQDVYVEEDGVRKVAEMLFDKVLEKDFSVAGWKSSHELNPQVVSEDAVNWVFLVDALNFSFWSESEDHKCLVKYKGKMYSGYWSLCAAVNRALDEG